MNWMIRFHLVATLFYFYTIAFSPNALTLYFSVMPLLLLPRTRWSRPHSFVERDSYSVHWVDLPVECRLEVSMSSQAFLDEPASASPCPQRQRFKPLYVLVVEEHVTDCDDLFVDLEGMSSQNDTFSNDPVEGWRETCASCN